MKRILPALFIGCLFLSFTSAPVVAGEVDILINKFVEKGMLSRGEATGLITEMQREGSRQKEEIKEVAKAAAKEEVKAAPLVELPKWVQKIKFKGDLRLRYQGQETDPADPSLTGQHRSRGRYRLRVGVAANVNDQWKAGFRIASGGNDPRSTNETLDDTFSSKGWMVDRAYAQYKPFKSLAFLGGKFGNPLWKTKDLMWDSDVNPEGVAVKIKYRSMESLELFFTPAFFTLEEFGGDTADPTMWAFQGGLNWKFVDNMYFKFAPTYYATDNIRGNDMTAGGAFGAGTNSQNAAVAYQFEYNSIAADAEIGFTEISAFVPYFALFGQYVQSDAVAAFNDDQEDDNTGYLCGFKFGHKEIKELWQWQAKYNYRRLERDAWADFLPDSDFYGGDTNVKGWEAEFKLAINKNVTLGLDYYNAELIRYAAGQTEEGQELIQLDLQVKW